MALTEDHIFELQLGIARTKAREPDPAKKAELDAQIDFYDLERARIISANNAQRIALLQPKLVRLEEIIRELGDPSLLVPVNIFRQRAEVPAPPEPVEPPAPPEPVEPPPPEPAEPDPVEPPPPPPPPPPEPLEPPTPPEPEEPEEPEQPGPVVDPVPDPPPSPGVPPGFSGPHILVSETDLDALARVAQSEVEIFGNFGHDQLVGGVAAVIDTILNRVAHPSDEFPDTITGVIDQPAQFSAINNVGSWTGLPAAKPALFSIAKHHVSSRAAGHSSALRGALHFLNPNTANPAAVNGWGRHVIENPVARFGDLNGRFLHVHGFAEGYRPPSPHAIEYKGKITWFEGTGMPIDVPAADIAGDRFSLPPSWKPNVQMDRIICHWTAGAHSASGLDKFHYHIMIEQDGNVVRGKFSIADNVSNLVWEPRSYAAHTKGANTKSIGVSVCCMANAKESPFNAGQFPMTETQWNRMVEVVADLCRHYNIPSTPTTVLGHGEVQANLGKPQDGKWDPMVLPWNPGLSKSQVGNLFRERVSALL